jgi:hypothetical protein
LLCVFIASSISTELGVGESNARSIEKAHPRSEASRPYSERLRCRSSSRPGSYPSLRPRTATKTRRVHEPT